MSHVIATIMTILFLISISEVELRPVNPKSDNPKAIDMYTEIQMETLSTEEKNHFEKSQNHRARMQKNYGLSFENDYNEINNDMDYITTKHKRYNTDAVEDPFGALYLDYIQNSKPYKRKVNKELTTSTITGELKSVEKRFFSAFSRLKILSDMYKEIQQRGRHYRVHIFRDGDSQPTLGRSPGAPLRWG